VPWQRYHQGRLSRYQRNLLDDAGDTTQWKQVILPGQYAQSRFFSFTTYVAQGAAVDAILDVNIDPDAGSGNPFRRGSSGQQHNYTVNVGGPSGLPDVLCQSEVSVTQLSLSMIGPGFLYRA
jgi:hypothetical protein